MYMKKLCTFDWLKTSLLLLLLLLFIIIIIIIYYYYYYYYYYSIIMQHACKVVKQVQITNCTHTQNFVCFDSL